MEAPDCGEIKKIEVSVFVFPLIFLVEICILYCYLYGLLRTIIGNNFKI